jgi:hypothetical protein
MWTTSAFGQSAAKSRASAALKPKAYSPGTASSHSRYGGKYQTHCFFRTTMWGTLSILSWILSCARLLSKDTRKTAQGRTSSQPLAVIGLDGTLQAIHLMVCRSRPYRGTRNCCWKNSKILCKKPISGFLSTSSSGSEIGNGKDASPHSATMLLIPIFLTCNSPTISRRFLSCGRSFSTCSTWRSRTSCA